VRVEKMTIMDIVSLAKDIVTLLALLIGGALAVFVYFQLAPILKLRILPRWEDDSKEFLVVKFEIENRSRVRVTSPKGRIQVLKHKVERGAWMSHWVPFSEDAILPDEHPTEWQEPAVLFTTTRHIFPGETISVERLYHLPEDTVVLHIGLQVEIEMGLVGRIVTRKRLPTRQTTTCFVAKRMNVQPAARRTSFLDWILGLISAS
jgi:hypothetical protein